MYAEQLQRQLLLAAEAGGAEAEAVVTRLAAPLDAAIRLALQDALAAAAEEITCELAPGSVELRLRGRELDFVVNAPPVDTGAGDLLPPPPAEGDDATITRINLRLPDQLKTRIEQVAAGEGLSVNAWLVRAAAAGLERAHDGGRRRGRWEAQGPQRYTGWAR